MVVEMTSLGTAVRNVRRFFVLNPTSISYEYKWAHVPVKGRENEASPFQCRTSAGVISAGRRYEMTFEFTPLVDETQVRAEQSAVARSSCTPRRSTPPLTT